MAGNQRSGDQVTSSTLRKSCDSCAAMKVGCTKEKPTCARCAKHAQPCVYSAAKRAGRTSGGAQSRAKGEGTALTATPISPALTTVQTVDTATSSSTSSVVGVSSPPPDLNPRECSPSNSDIFARLMSPTESSLSAMPPNFYSEFDEPFASAVALSLENPPDGGASGASLFDFGLEDFSDNSSNNFANISSLFPASSEANGTPTPSTRDSVATLSSRDDAHISITNRTLQAAQPYHSKLSCQCLPRALGLLARLSPGTSGLGNLGTDNNPSPELPHHETVIAQNEQTSDVIRKILQCSCSNDSYLLVILSLEAFKIIAWYTAAACRASGEDPAPDTAIPMEWQSHLDPLETASYKASNNQSDYDSEGEDQRRIAVQLILSKLANVQTLVDQLSQRLQKVWDKTNFDGALDSPLETASPPSLLAGGNALRRPFSAELAHTLEADLRKRLYELSQAIIERLRQ